MVKKHNFRVIEGGKGKGDVVVPDLSDQFDATAFLHITDDFIVQSDIPPEYFGKTMGGITYGDPTKQSIILYTNEDGQPVFDL